MKKFPSKNMMKISEKAKKLTSSPLYVFFRKVKELESQGKEIISLGVGEPYYQTPEAIKNAAIEAIKDNKTHYNPAAGSMELRKAIAGRYSVSSEQVLVSSGAKPFLGSILWALVDSGDVLYMAEPFYPPFVQIAESCGAKVELMDTDMSGFQLTASLVAETVGKNKGNVQNSYIIINSPNNPTGDRKSVV